MWDLARNSISLFFAGKLFADPAKVYSQISVGIVVTAALLIALAVAGVALWLAALVAGLAGGGLQPYLFKDLKYR